MPEPGYHASEKIGGDIVEIFLSLFVGLLITVYDLFLDMDFYGEGAFSRIDFIGEGVFTGNDYVGKGAFIRKDFVGEGVLNGIDLVGD